MQEDFHELVGVVPAAGIASRLGPLPCSKELLQVGFQHQKQSSQSQPKVVSHYLLEKMRRADVHRAYIIIRHGKWDIPAYFGDGKMLDMHIGYLIMDLPYGVPFTLDQAYPFLTNAKIAFGFPDIIFKPEDAFVKLFSKQQQTDADIVLGLFEASSPQKMDMVEIDNRGNIYKIVIKPANTQLRYTWIIAVWTDRFTRFMHRFVLEHKCLYTAGANGTAEKNEVFVGDVIQAALNTDIRVEKVIFADGYYIDIGTPGDLAKAVHDGIGKQNGFK